MIITTGNDVAGHQIVQYLGLVRGIVVRSTGIARGIVGGLRSIGGGNTPEYVAVRYDATEFTEGATEVLAYGTAVKIQKA